jgi:hypothetical protein
MGRSLAPKRIATLYLAPARGATTFLNFKSRVREPRQLTGDYASYIKRFIQINDPLISGFVQQKLQEGAFYLLNSS